MNPKVSHALVGVVAFVLGAVALHHIVLFRMAAVERELLDEARTLAERRPVDLGSIEGFMTRLNARRAITSAKAHEDASLLVLGPIEYQAMTASDAKRGVFDLARFEAVAGLIQRQFDASARAQRILSTMQIDRANGMERCLAAVDPDDRRAVLQAITGCEFMEPAQREQAGRELAREGAASKP